MIILPNEAWEWEISTKIKMWHLLIYVVIVSEWAVNEVIGIGGLQGGSITRAASVLGLKLLPAHSLQQLPPISHFKHYLIYVLAQPVVHILHFFSLIASLCARDMWIYQKVQIEREKRGWKDSNSLIENKSLHIVEHVGI